MGVIHRYLSLWRYLPFHNVDHYGYNSPPRQSTLAHHNGKGSPMHISRAVEDDSVGTYGGPSSSSMSQESSTPASAFSVGSISPLGTLATFAEANPSDSSFSAGDLSNSKDSPMLTDPPTMYMDGYTLGAAYMHDVDGYEGDFGFIPPSAPVLPYHLAYDYLQDADNDRGVSTCGQNDVLNSVPTSALLLNRIPALSRLKVSDHRHTQLTGRGRGRGRGKARSTAVSRGKMTQAGKGSPRGHLTLDTASINANDRGPEVGSPGSRKRSVNGMDDNESSDLPHNGPKDGGNTEGSDDREAKRARTQSDSMASIDGVYSTTALRMAFYIPLRMNLRLYHTHHRLLAKCYHQSVNREYVATSIGQHCRFVRTHRWRYYRHICPQCQPQQRFGAESGEGSNEGSAFEDAEDGSEYEDEDDDDDEYVQGRSSGRRKSTIVRRAGNSGGKNVSAAWALEKVQGGSGGPIIDTSTCGASDEINEATNMYNRNGKTRRKRISNIPLPIPVPNLTKKSRGRKVPSFPADLASSYGYDASAESSPSGYASREGISKRGTRGRRVPTVVGGPSLEERPFVCEVSECNKRFVRGEHLKRHVRSIHTLDKRKCIVIRPPCKPDAKKSNYSLHMSAKGVRKDVQQKRQPWQHARVLDFARRKIHHSHRVSWPTVMLRVQTARKTRTRDRRSGRERYDCNSRVGDMRSQRMHETAPESSNTTSPGAPSSTVSPIDSSHAEEDSTATVASPGAQFVSRVSTLPLVNTAIRVYEHGKNSSRVVKLDRYRQPSGIGTEAPLLSSIKDANNEQEDGVSRSFETKSEVQRDNEGNHSSPRSSIGSQHLFNDPDHSPQSDTLSNIAKPGTDADPPHEAKPTNGDAAGDSQAVVQRSRWHTVLSEAGGLSAALSDESMKRLKYCLEWLLYATSHIDAQMLVLRDFIAQLQPIPPNSDSLTLSTQFEFSPSVSHMHLRTLNNVRRDIVHTIRQVVDVVSKYAGGALPEPARTRVRGFILKLPQRWASRASTTVPTGASIPSVASAMASMPEDTSVLEDRTA
ncbi:zf-C2H2 Zinc finger [Salix suchowensis]|nr:zf-C2H2 Zinc finger [Salix suchowensis]